jgi:hypothetical protein
MSVLVVDIEDVLALEPEGVSGAELARRLHRRKEDVLEALGNDPRFALIGAGRHRRWALATGTDGGTEQEPLDVSSGTNAGTDMAVEIEAANRLSGPRCLEPQLHASFRAHWRDEAGIVRCARCEPNAQPQPLTFRRWIAGEGTDDARFRFEVDWLAVTAGTASAEQRERFAVALKEES